jgi:hypothetical protein
MPRFVILEHDHPVLHWDLMLECNGILRTWRLAVPPEGEQEILAEASFDHRLYFLEYEGPISNNRGQVTRWDAGIYELQEESAARLTIRFDGSRLVGRALLERRGEAEWMFRRVKSMHEEGEIGSSSSGSEQEGKKEGPDEPVPPA